VESGGNAANGGKNAATNLCSACERANQAFYELETLKSRPTLAAIPPFSTDFG